jgi:imidazolonepropionase-like amidohydrolase
MKVADLHGFKVNTFTHILEGYKVADKMKEHGVGASSFADWYNYKMEVVDAIPYNPSILNKMGVVTAINSDDAEMGRRLNQEAAKSIKYGGMSEEEALKMVTLNPAKLLHLDDRIGSIRAGKDADVVLWTGNPLSVYSRPLYTIIDGTVYFDHEEDQKMMVWIQQERARLMAKIKLAAESGEKTEPVTPHVPKHFHCDDIFVDNQ